MRFERCSMRGVRVERALLICAMFHGCRGSQRLVRGDDLSDTAIDGDFNNASFCNARSNAAS
ncbi:hypothetical protein ACFSLT_30665 [Novosphingobium resinovorum]